MCLEYSGPRSDCSGEKSHWNTRNRMLLSELHKKTQVDGAGGLKAINCNCCPRHRPTRSQAAHPERLAQAYHYLSTHRSIGDTSSNMPGPSLRARDGTHRPTAQARRAYCSNRPQRSSYLTYRPQWSSYLTYRRTFSLTASALSPKPGDLYLL